MIGLASSNIKTSSTSVVHHVGSWIHFFHENHICKHQNIDKLLWKVRFSHKMLIRIDKKVSDQNFQNINILRQGKAHVFTRKYF